MDTPGKVEDPKRKARAVAMKLARITAVHRPFHSRRRQTSTVGVAAPTHASGSEATSDVLPSRYVWQNKASQAPPSGQKGREYAECNEQQSEGKE